MLRESVFEDYVDGEESVYGSSPTNSEDSVNIKDKSPSQFGFERPVPNTLRTGGFLTLSPIADRPDSLLATWEVSSPSPSDNIRLYIHDRLHDENYLSFAATSGEARGSHVFSGLVRGYYDVRFFREESKAHADDISVAVCCLGPIVRFAVSVGQAPLRMLTVRVPSDVVEGPNDWLALFPDGEHSNRYHRCCASALESQAKSVPGSRDVIFTLQMPKKEGLYDLRYFFGNSLSLQNGNAFSGRSSVMIPCDDSLKASYDVENRICRIAWKIYSVDPNNWQWIGLYDGAGNLLSCEYVCYHSYTTNTKTEGVVTLKKLPRKLLDWSETGVMPREIRNWQLRFYNTYFSAMITEPVIKAPFLN